MKKISNLLFGLMVVLAGFSVMSCSEEEKESKPAKITLGTWPQSIASLTDTEIASLTETGRIIQGNKEYEASNGTKYVKVTAVLDPGNIKYYKDNPAIFSDGKIVDIGATYYFKVEPIVWQRLGQTNKFVSEKILTNLEYYDYEDTVRISSDVIYPNNYQHSKIRAFLNGLSYEKRFDDFTGSITETVFENNGFFQLAFKESETAKIKTELVKNDGLSTAITGESTKADGSKQKNDGSYYPDFTCPDTLDKIYLLSLQEVTDSKYGFDEYIDEWWEDEKRGKVVTDYAIAMDPGQYQRYDGYKQDDNSWVLRSPCYNDLNRVVSCRKGYLYSTGLSTITYRISVVPALTISE